MHKMIRKAVLWRRDENGVAAAEMALVFPIMLLLLLGIWDLGNGILINQKAIAASHIVIDLIGRQEDVSDAEFDQAIQAGLLAMMPYDTGTMMIDVVSATFDASDDPLLLWQETSTGSAGNAQLLSSVAGLGVEGDGALVIEVTYQYVPLFAGHVIGTINMRERVFSRGRASTTVTRS